MEFYIHGPETPTRITTEYGRPSTLNLVISNNLMQMAVNQDREHIELLSDHLSVTTTIDVEISVIPARKTSRRRYFDKTTFV